MPPRNFRSSSETLQGQAPYPNPDELHNKLSNMLLRWAFPSIDGRHLNLPVYGTRLYANITTYFNLLRTDHQQLPPSSPPEDIEAERGRFDTNSLRAGTALITIGFKQFDPLSDPDKPSAMHHTLPVADLHIGTPTVAKRLRPVGIFVAGLFATLEPNTAIHAAPVVYDDKDADGKPLASYPTYDEFMKNTHLAEFLHHLTT